MHFLKNLEIKRLSKVFKEETIKYIKQVNDFRAEGMESKWLDPVEMDSPIDTREKYAEKIYDAILEFNKKGNIQELRELFPPQSEIFYSHAEQDQDIPNIRNIVAVDHERFLVALSKFEGINEVGFPSFKSTCYLCENGNFSRLEEIQAFGTCPQKKIFAYVTANEIVLKSGWDGDIVRKINLPTKAKIYFNDNSIAVHEYDMTNMQGACYVPFSDGSKILIGSEDFGLLLMESDKNTIIYPEKRDFEIDEDKINDELDYVDCAMFHFSLSHNNKYIAVGRQSSSHFLYSVTGELLGELEPTSSYPHYALFSRDDSQVMFNSCHFYNGGTLAVRVEDMKLDKQHAENKSIELDAESRVYSAISTSFGYIIGDGYGYLRARSHEGDYLWDDFLGFNIDTMDITEDEKILYVGTNKGVIYKIHLNYGEKSPYEIGNSNNKEVRRWMFWEPNTILEW